MQEYYQNIVDKKKTIWVMGDGYFCFYLSLNLLAFLGRVVGDGLGSYVTKPPNQTGADDLRLNRMNR